MSYNIKHNSNSNNNRNRNHHHAISSSRGATIKDSSSISTFEVPSRVLTTTPAVPMDQDRRSSRSPILSTNHHRSSLHQGNPSFKGNDDDGTAMTVTTNDSKSTTTTTTTILTRALSNELTTSATALSQAHQRAQGGGGGGGGGGSRKRAAKRRATSNSTSSSSSSSSSGDSVGSNSQGSSINSSSKRSSRLKKAYKKKKNSNNNNSKIQQKKAAPVSGAADKTSTELAVPIAKAASAADTFGDCKISNTTNISVTTKSSTLPFEKIQPWHVVLGDTHCRPDRTTAATTLLRDMKVKYQNKHYRGKRSEWIPQAVQEFQTTLRAMFGQDVGEGDDDDDEVGRVLWRCTSRAKGKIILGHQDNPAYGYANVDSEALFGQAKSNVDSLQFFLESRDAPKLNKELYRYQKELPKLRHRHQHRQQRGATRGRGHVREPSPAAADSENATTITTQQYLDEFDLLLKFLQERVQQADGGNVVAKAILDEFKPIPALKKVFKTLESTCKATEQQIDNNNSHREQVSMVESQLQIPPNAAVFMSQHSLGVKSQSTAAMSSFGDAGQRMLANQPASSVATPANHTEGNQCPYSCPQWQTELFAASPDLSSIFPGTPSAYSDHPIQSTQRREAREPPGLLYNDVVPSNQPHRQGIDPEPSVTNCYGVPGISDDAVKDFEVDDEDLEDMTSAVSTSIFTDTIMEESSGGSSSSSNTNNGYTTNTTATRTDVSSTGHTTSGGETSSGMMGGESSDYADSSDHTGSDNLPAFSNTAMHLGNNYSNDDASSSGLQADLLSNDLYNIGDTITADIQVAVSPTQEILLHPSHIACIEFDEDVIMDNETEYAIDLLRQESSDTSIPTALPVQETDFGRNNSSEISIPTSVCVQPSNSESGSRSGSSVIAVPDHYWNPPDYDRALSDVTTSTIQAYLSPNEEVLVAPPVQIRDEPVIMNCVAVPNNTEVHLERSRKMTLGIKSQDDSSLIASLRRRELYQEVTRHRKMVRDLKVQNDSAAGFCQGRVKEFEHLLNFIQEQICLAKQGNADANNTLETLSSSTVIETEWKEIESSLISMNKVSEDASSVLAFEDSKFLSENENSEKVEEKEKAESTRVVVAASDDPAALKIAADRIQTIPDEADNDVFERENNAHLPSHLGRLACSPATQSSVTDSQECVSSPAFPTRAKSQSPDDSPCGSLAKMELPNSSNVLKSTESSTAPFAHSVDGTLSHNDEKSSPTFIGSSLELQAQQQVEQYFESKSREMPMKAYEAAENNHSANWISIPKTKPDPPGDHVNPHGSSCATVSFESTSASRDSTDNIADDKETDKTDCNRSSSSSNSNGVSLRENHHRLRFSRRLGKFLVRRRRRRQKKNHYHQQPPPSR